MSARGELRLKAVGAEQPVLLEGPRFTIGRGADNSLCLPDLLVSRYHAEIIRLGDGFLLRDLGSRNGCFVNGARVATQMLNDGDQLRLGADGPELIFRETQEDGRTGPQARASWDRTRSLADSFSGKLERLGGDALGEANLRCALAEEHLNKGRHEAAREVIAQYADASGHGGLPPQFRATVLYWVGRAYVECKQYELAVDALQNSLEFYTGAADHNGVAEVHAALGRARIGAGDLLGARDSLHRSMLAARRAANVRLRAEVHLLLGKVDWKEGDFEGARYNWKRAPRLAEGLNDAVLLARIRLQQALVLSAEGKLQEAIPAYQAVIDQIQAAGHVPLLLKAYSGLARVLMRQGLWAAAERLHPDRLRLAREHRLRKAEAIAQTDLAESRLLQGDLPGAARSIEEALPCHGKTVYGRTQQVLGQILGARGRTQEAVDALKKGLDAARAQGAVEDQALIGLDLALVLLGSGDLPGASEQLEAAASPEPTLNLMARSLYVRGAVHAASGRTQEANRCLTQSLSTFQSTGDPFQVGLCHTALGALRARMGNSESARAHLDEARRIFAKLGAAAELQRIEARLASADLANVKAGATRFVPGVSQAAPLSMSMATVGRLDTAASLAPPRVLIAVADDNLATMLRRGLEADNYVVDRVRDGREALDRATARQNSYWLLVLDALLEHRSGFDVCRDLRKHDLETPVILLGGRQGVEDKIEALQAGAHDFIGKKNLVFEELLAKMEALLR